MNIILCGLPMCGKTTIGKLLATRLNWNFIDTDRSIEQAYTLSTGKICSCRQIYSDKGEHYFRILEQQQIVGIKDVKESVIAVGGGSCIEEENIKNLKSIGKFVYIKVSLADLWGRIQKHGLPAYLEPSNPERAFYLMAEKRQPVFEHISHAYVDATFLNEEETVTEVLNLGIGQYGQ